MAVIFSFSVQLLPMEFSGNRGQAFGSICPRTATATSPSTSTTRSTAAMRPGGKSQTAKKTSPVLIDFSRSTSVSSSSRRKKDSWARSPPRKSFGKRFIRRTRLDLSTLVFRHHLFVTFQCQLKGYLHLQSYIKNIALRWNLKFMVTWSTNRVKNIVSLKNFAALHCSKVWNFSNFAKIQCGTIVSNDPGCHSF